MQQALTQPEVRFRFILKSLLIVSLFLTLYHLFSNWRPYFFSNILHAGFILMSNGSMMQAVLIILLLMLVIGDIRRFGVIVRLFISFLFCRFIIYRHSHIQASCVR